MEAVPKLPMISFELKGSPEMTHFGPKLKQYIAEVYRESPDNYGKEMHQLEGLRSAAVRPSSDDAGLVALTKYFCQLRAMQSRFPMAKGAPASVTFVWKDLYANMNCTSADIRFEMACILYNIGALHTQLGASEPRTTPESLKAACTHYQHAAWCFQYLKEHYPQPPGVDVSPEIMRLLQEICFAQAQECILDKSIQDTKTKTVGAVATQVMYFYNNCLAMLGPSTGQDNIHEIIGTKLYNYWHRYLSFKHSYVGCIVCLYQGMIAETEQNMGMRVAYYQSAVDKLGEARKLAKYIEPVVITQEALTFTNDVVEGKRKAAKNENEFIYHEEVPDKNLLVDLKPVCVVKALPINFKDPEVWGPDLFARLIPICAHEASSLYSEVKAKLLRRVGNQVESKTMELYEFMSSLQLDQLDVLDSEQKIPQEIVDRCAAMNAKAEIIQTLIDSMNNLAEIISDVEEALAECKNFIKEDTAQEKEYQKSMGPRPPSIVQTELSREYNKYQEAHSRTNESNQVLHKAMTLHIANLLLLAQPLDYLQTKIPNVDNIVGLDRETMLEMRRVVGKAREMQAQRDSLLQELRDDVTADDITGTLLARASQVPDEEIFAQEIEKHTPKVKIIEQNLAAQENIINRLTSLYAAYGESRRLLADVLRKREGLINALITSYDSYSELLSKSGKGAEFYRKLAHNVGQLQARLRSTCQVQAEEREQLLNPTANRASADSPPAPASPAPASPAPPAPPAPGYTPRLKDYLPYMKGRGYGRPTPQAEVMPTEPYYPDTIYPTTVRPTPVGSVATTDAPQMPYSDGYVSQTPNQYNPYPQYTTKDTNLYNPQNNYGYPVPSSGMPFEPPKEADGYAYSSAYTPPQFSGQSANPQTYNPYYTATQQDSGTAVTESQYKQETIHPNTSQYNPANVNQDIRNAPGMSQSQPNSNPQYQQGQYNPGSSQANANPNTSQYNAYQYAASQAVPNPATPIPDAVSSMSAYSMNLPDLSLTFSQMNVSGPKPAIYDPQSGHADYSQTYYSVAYPMNATSPNLATYSHAPHNSNTTMVQSQTPSDYNTQNYPFGPADQTVPTSIPPTVNAVSNAYTVSEQAYNYASTSGFENPAQGYPIYTNADNTGIYSTATSTVSTAPPGFGQPYTFLESDGISAATLANLDAMDKPIKSHVTGEALSVNYFQPNAQQYPTVASPANSYTTPTEQRVPQSNQYSYNEQTSSQFAQPSQNHPGYTFNATSGSYEYNYGSQNSHSNYNPAQVNPDPNAAGQNQDPGVYTSAGTYATVQSPSESHQIVPEVSNQTNEMYYNNQQQYGYQTIQPNDTVPDAQSPTNYGADVNQSTYVHSMHSGEGQTTGVTYTNNQVSTPVDNVPEAPNFNQSTVGNNQTQNYSSDYQNVPQGYQPGEQSGENSQSYQQENNPNDKSKYNHTSYIQVNYPNEASSSSQPGNQDIQTVTEPSSHEVSPVPQTPTEQPPPEPKLTTEEKPEQSTFDLLSDIDFSVEIKPLMPEIKVPQISETAVKKPIFTPKEVPKPAPPKVEELIRPAKKDLFSDPGLMNKFTEEVKSLQKFVDSMTSKTVGGVTLLDAKWKTLQDIQSKENMKRSKNVAMKYTSVNIVTVVVPYDDSRLMLKSDSEVYINASCYKQLAPWCIPLVISNSPAENDQVTFWKAVLENKISCIVCLLSEIEMQGKCYWPTAIGHSLDVGGVRVTLEDASCNVHWTERRLAVAGGNAAVSVAHYQINVFPAKIVCSPLVLLADKMLSITYESRLSNQLGTAWVHCSAGAGRSAVLALLTMLMCQVRAGQINLCDMIDAACSSLYQHRSNVLEDTKYLADAYRTALFYVQGVLCSGTTSFNGETITTQSGASILPPVNATTSNKDGLKTQKFSRESFEEMKQTPGLTSGDMKDPLNFLDPLWSLKKK